MGEETSSSNGFQVDEDEDMSLYRKDATSVVFFKIVFNEDDMASKSDQFKPAMAHQIFGDSESIFGYRSLSINLYYLHNSARCYVDIRKASEIKSNKPDDIMKSLKPWLPEGFTTSDNDFQKMMKNEKHDLIYGTVLNEFPDKKESKPVFNRTGQMSYKITKCDISDENFLDFHSRFETFIIWYIDGANAIDLSDGKWMIYYVYEEFKNAETEKVYRSPIGYCTVYKFYAYPDSIRPRISQFFILPPWQRRGIGSQLYKTIVNDIRNIPNVVDITVEEPTSHFQKIRDFNDCLTLQKDLKEAKMDIVGTSPKKIFEFMKKEKICKKQTQRVLDILNCYNAVKSSTTEYKSCLANIKSRIATDVEKETRGSKRICNLERAGVIVEPPDREVLIETEYKRYINDIEPSIKCLERHFNQ